ncbi:NADP-dependent oxidoreductase [Sphingomonas sp. 1P06PA]|uniref:NADP-dependent oxidoreductase n=1 Tax=Sphingomonas sp. 1P06PA TaxID=554121 RepID=UPI0039A78469
MPANRRFLLTRRPQGTPVAEDFTLEAAETTALQDGQFLLRNEYASLDPAIRGWMDDVPSYLPPIRLGDPVRATTIGRIAESRHPDYPVGAWASGLNGIEEYSLCQGGGFTTLVDADAVPKITNYLSSVGAIGLTAYFALLDVGRPQPGDVVLVSGAAGAVGSLVGQIAKLKGCRTIGIAGGPDKCARLISDYGYDAAIDYRGKSGRELAAEIRAAAPDGIDIHFENVGGEILDAALLALKPKGRVILCGLISQYNSGPKPTYNIWQLIVQGARMEGFILTHYIPRFAEAIPDLAAWTKAGTLRVDEHIDEGIENALPAFLRLFEGSNQGKMILKI